MDQRGVCVCVWHVGFRRRHCPTSFVIKVLSLDLSQPSLYMVTYDHGSGMTDVYPLLNTKIATHQQSLTKKQWQLSADGAGKLNPDFHKHTVFSLHPHVPCILVRLLKVHCAGVAWVRLHQSHWQTTTIPVSLVRQQWSTHGQVSHAEVSPRSAKPRSPHSTEGAHRGPALSTTIPAILSSSLRVIRNSVGIHLWRALVEFPCGVSLVGFH